MKKMDWLILFAGLNAFAAGTILSINVAFGSTGWGSLIYGLSSISSITVGTWSYICGAIVILIGYFFSRKAMLGLLSFIVTIVFGLLVDIYNNLLPTMPNHPALLTLLLVVALMLISLGIALMLSQPGPKTFGTYTVSAIHDSTGYKKSRIIIISDILFLSLGSVLALISGNWNAIGFGTILIVGLTGPLVGRWLKLIKTK